MKIKFNNEKGTIQLLRVRASYPHVYSPYGREGDDKKKYSIRGMLSQETHAAEIEALKKHLVQLQKEWFKAKLPSANLFFRDGADTGAEEYENHWYISASEKIPPQILGRDKKPLPESSGLIVGGAIVNLLIKPWKQDNKWGKKINANLLGVQWVEDDGVRFGAERPDASEEFEDFEDADDDNDGFDD